MSSGTQLEDDGFGYVSPADFDEPGDKEDDVKVKDEVDLPILEEVVLYFENEIANLSNIKSLTATEDEDGLELKLQLILNQRFTKKLDNARKRVIAIIEGIDEKYDDTSR